MQKLIRNVLRRSPEGTAVPLKTSTSPAMREDCVFPWTGELQALNKSSTVDVITPPQPASSCYSWLQMVAPAFPVRAEKIHLLTEPNEFYQTLLKKCTSANHRIVISSLYLGTGHLEKTLVNCIRQRMTNLQGQLKATFLFDHCRGSRGSENSRSMVEPLLKEQSESVQVSLYHTVELRGILKWVLPQRFDEIVGLQHMKLYIFDNTVIISGANLSHDYFTNRQDRYVVIEDCADLANFYVNLIQKVSEFSFQLLPDGTTELHSSWPPDCHPYHGDKKKFIQRANEHVSKALKSNNNLQTTQNDTWVYPLIQMGQLGIYQDSQVTLDLLKRVPLGSQIHLATGYFNLPEEYMDTILKKSQASYRILTAHPSTNGFLNAHGLAGGIPALYTQLAKEFFHCACKMEQQDRIEIHEYVHPGWTYHGKGLWLTLPGQKLPSLTLIGSPNFGSRSVERDLETQVAIVTSNEQLQKRLAHERDQLFEKGQRVNKSTFSQRDRHVPLWVFCISRLFRRSF